MDVDLYRADIGAGAAEGGGKGKVGVFFHIQVRGQDGANGARNGVVVAQAATFAVNGAGVHAAAALDALQGVPEIRLAQHFAPSPVHQYQVHFLPLSGFLEVAGVDGDGLPGGASGQKP